MALIAAPGGRRRQWFLAWASVLSIVLVLAATGSPREWPPYRDELGDLVILPGDDALGTWREARADPWAVASILLYGNVLLYIPVGLFVSLATRSRGRGLLACLVLSLVVETTEFLALSRIASTDDVLTNLAGGAVGVIMAAACSSLTSRRHPG